MVVLDAEATFPEVTLWRSGVHLQDRTSIPAYLHLYIGRDRASAADSIVDFLPFEIERGLSPAFSAAQRPKWQIIHAHSPGGRTIEPQLLGPGQSRPIERLPLGAGVATQVTRR